MTTPKFADLIGWQEFYLSGSVLQQGALDIIEPALTLTGTVTNGLFTGTGDLRHINASGEQGTWPLISMTNMIDYIVGADFDDQFLPKDRTTIKNRSQIIEQGLEVWTGRVVFRLSDRNDGVLNVLRDMRGKRLMFVKRQLAADGDVMVGLVNTQRRTENYLTANDELVTVELTNAHDVTPFWQDV